MSSTLDPQRVAAILAETALSVVLPRFRRLAGHEIREKNPGDLVTVADQESEAVLSARLTRLLPGSRVVGEEAASADPDILNLLQEDDPVWVIDPIDGTANFVKGDERFGMMVALVHRRVTLWGWIHDPLSRRTYHASAGGGAWCGERRLRIAPRPATGMIGCAGGRERERLERAGLGFRQIGSAAQEYLALLETSLNFSFYRRLHPWDHAAGVLLHREAGGHAALLDGREYVPAPQGGALLMAPDPQSWRTLKSVFDAET